MIVHSIYGETLLYQAVNESKLDMVKVLLELGANPHAENYMDGETPLMMLAHLNEDYNDRTPVQEQIDDLLLHTKQSCATCGKTQGKLMRCSQCHAVKYCSRKCQKTDWKTHKKTCEKVKTEHNYGKEIWDLIKDKYWAINVDPAEVEDLQKRCRENPNDIIAHLRLRQWADALTELEETQDNETIACSIRRNKITGMAKKFYDGLCDEQQCLLDEAFHIVQVSCDEELQCESTTALVARVKEIYSRADMDVYWLSPCGLTLLYECVTNFILEEDEEAYIELVRFVLDQGADPNVVNWNNETSLDNMDDVLADVGYEMTDAQQEVTRMLMTKGGLIQDTDDEGNPVGERGKGVSRLERALVQHEDGTFAVSS